MNLRPILLAVLLVTLVTPAVSSQAEIALGGGKVTYFVAGGKHNASHFALGPAYDGQGALPFEGCLYLQTRPRTDQGLLAVVGVINKTTMLEFTVNEFNGTHALQQGGIAENVTLDGSVEAGRPTHPSVMARLAAWGVGVFGAHGEDPTAADAYIFASRVMVTREGFRNNDTKRIETPEGGVYDPSRPDNAKIDPQDWEIHLNLRQASNPGPVRFQKQSAGEGGQPMIVNEENVRQSVPFRNQRFGGETELTFRVTSRAPPAGPSATELTFYVYSSSHAELAKKTIRPLPGIESIERVTVPMLEFGTYEVYVEGRATLTNYTIQGIQRAPKDLELNFWWDDVLFEWDAVDDNSVCLSEIGTTFDPVVTDTRRPKTPTWNTQVVAVGIFAGILSVLFLVKLASDQISTSAFRSTFRKR